MIKTYLRQSYECRTIVARIIGECFTTFARHSCDIRETLARCSPDKIASIYYHRPPHDVLTNVVRLSYDCRAKVVRLSRDGFARNVKPRKINIEQALKRQTRKVLRCWKELEGLLEGVKLLGGVGLLKCSKNWVRKKLTRLSCTVMMAHHLKKVSREHTCSNCPHGCAF